jgi:kynurenine formamidase
MRLREFIQKIPKANFYDLTHELYHNMPVYPTVRPFSINLINFIAKDKFEARELIMITHHGTHFDAPTHMIENGKSIDKFDISNFIQPAAVLNLSTILKPKEEISSNILIKFENVIKRNNAILFYTGWSKKRGFNSEYILEWPYIDIDGAKYIASFDNIKILGTDSLSIAGYNGNAHVIETHRILLEKNILILEELNFNTLAEVIADKEYIEGTLIALPLLIKDGDGSPARVVFILD